MSNDEHAQSSASSVVSLVRTMLLGCGLLILTSLQDVSAQDPISCAKVGVGPQSPRDLVKLVPGTNPITFEKAPPVEQMHLCNVHFHQFAEHKGTEYSEQTGEGDHKGFYCNKHTAKPKEGGDGTACKPKAGHGAALAIGDTIEVHWVYTTCDVKPAPGLSACASCGNARLRVEARVFYLTDDPTARGFADKEGKIALPVTANSTEYFGSTTGSEKYSKPDSCSPLPVTWNVSQACSPLNITSIGDWCANPNAFEEDHGHGVRPLVEDPKLLSAIK
jgi:cadmium carbonic anhydrase-like repeat protein